MPDTPEMPASSPQLLRSQAVARDIEGVLGRIERKLDRLDMTTARAAGDLRAEFAGGASDLRNVASGLRSEIRGARSEARWLIVTTLTGFCVVLAALGRGFGWL